MLSFSVFANAFQCRFHVIFDNSGTSFSTHFFASNGQLWYELVS
jgi:hypothetical protein